MDCQHFDLITEEYIFIEKQSKIKITILICNSNINTIKLEILKEISKESFKEFKKDVKIDFNEEVYFSNRII